MAQVAIRIATQKTGGMRGMEKISSEPMEKSSPQIVAAIDPATYRLALTNSGAGRNFIPWMPSKLTSRC
jgi:hypothetical protein